MQKGLRRSAERSADVRQEVISVGDRNLFGRIVLVVVGYLAFMGFLFGKVNEQMPAQGAENGATVDEQDIWDERVDIEEPSVYADAKMLTLRYYETYEYDEDGNLLAERRYDEDGKLVRYETTSYDARGNPVANEYHSYYFGGRDQVDYYTYDLDGNILTRESYLDGRLSFLSEYSRKDEGTVCVTTYFEYTGEISSMYGQIYDEYDNKLADYHYNNDGTIASYEHARYDDQGRCIYRSIGRGDPSGTPMKELVMEWDDEEHTCIETLYEPVGHTNAIQYSTYNEDWRQTRGLRYFSGYWGHSKEEWSLELGFSKGYWAVVTDGLVRDEMQYSDQAVEYYRVYGYDAAGNRVVKVEYKFENHLATTTLTYDIYNENGRREERYTYRVWSDWVQECDDGSETSFSYDAEGKLSSITRTGADGTVEQQMFFDADGDLIGQYVPELGELWTEELPGHSDEGPRVLDDRQMHVVQKGESLWKIAEEYYEDGLRWGEIYRENWEIIGPDPDFIPPGMELVLPE